MLIKIYKKRRSHPKMALLEAGRDLNPWSLHRNILVTLTVIMRTFCFGLPQQPLPPS
jgi:hypothetical protein